jgi:hypothetical protein
MRPVRDYNGSRLRIDVHVSWKSDLESRATSATLAVVLSSSHAEMARILSAQGPQARVYLDALADTLNRRAALAPTLNWLGDQAGLGGLMFGGRYARNRLAAPSDRPQSN